MNSIQEAAGRLERRHWFLLWVLGAAAFFQGYDISIVTVAMRQIRHTFGLSQAAASLWVGLLFLGALPAIFLTRQADRRGRRGVLLLSVLGYTIATGVTALAPTMGAFVTCQFFARLFLATENALVWTMVAEELPAGSRGFGFGWMSMLAALGTGTCALIYGALLNPLGASWRWLYVLAVPPLLGMAWLRQRLPESKRFEEAQRARALARRWHQILQPPHRRWLSLLCLTAILATLTTHAATFAVDFLETTHHLSATKASLLIVGAGGPAIAMLIVAGALSDRYGRKLIGCSFGVLAVVGALSFFFLANSLWSLALTMTITFVGTFGAGPALGAFGTELFPTSLRALGGSAVSISHVVGQSISLGLGGLLLHLTGSMPDTVAVLVLGPLAMIVVVAVWFPETHGRELEDIVDGLPAPGAWLGPVDLPVAVDLAVATDLGSAPEPDE
jgi:putative MFS transporter